MTYAADLDPDIHEWVSAMLKDLDHDRVDSIIREISRAGDQEPRAKIGAVIMACASVLASLIYDADPFIRQEMLRGIYFIIDGLVGQLVEDRGLAGRQ